MSYAINILLDEKDKLEYGLSLIKKDIDDEIWKYSYLHADVTIEEKIKHEQRVEVNLRSQLEDSEKWLSEIRVALKILRKNREMEI